MELVDITSDQDYAITESTESIFDGSTDDTISETTDSNIFNPIDNWISIMNKQIECNSHGIDFELDVDYYITDNYSSHPTPLENLHFDESDVPTTSGHKLRVYTISSGNDGLDILIVPGYMNSHIIYTNILTDKRLIDYHNVYIVDPRGTGASDSPSPNFGRYESQSQNADDINSVIKTLDIKNVVLVGHSIGWLHIGDYINKYGQEKLKGLVCIGGFPEGGTQYLAHLINPIYLNYLMIFINRTSLCHTDKINDFADVVKYSFLTNPGSHFKTLFSTDIWSIRRDIRLQVLAHEPVDYITNPDKPLWSQVTVPTLVQWGLYDNVISVQAAKEIYKTVPKSVLKIYNAKHYPFIDDQTRFMNDLYVFINKLSTI